MIHARDTLRQRGVKATPQRIAILHAIEEAGHIGIDDLYLRVRKEMPSLSLATVYKNLSGLQESGVVLQLTPPGQKAKYEVSKEEHAHMVCTVCGSVMDVGVETEAAVRAAGERNGFKVERVTLYMEGVCPRCG